MFKLIQEPRECGLRRERAELLATLENWCREIDVKIEEVC